MTVHSTISTSEFASITWVDDNSQSFDLHYTTDTLRTLYFTAFDVDKAIRPQSKDHNIGWVNSGNYEAYNTNHRPAAWAEGNRGNYRALLVKYETLIEYLSSGGIHHERKTALANWLRENTKYLSRHSTYPVTERSWTLLSPSVAIKTMDKSCFNDHGSGIPKDFTFFFGATAKDPDREITLIHNRRKYPGLLQPDQPQQRVRIFWRNGLDKVIERYFPEELEAYKADLELANPPELRFSRTHRPDEYQVEFIAPESVEQDIPIIPEDVAADSEGARQKITTTTRKRSAKNRRLAIEYHGLNCRVCGFNFEEVYGKLGKGFIEVHHITMLGTLDDEVEVNPKTDMIPLCSNCHRMIHKNGGGTVDEFIGLYEKRKK